MIMWLADSPYHSVLSSKNMFLILTISGAISLLLSVIVYSLSVFVKAALIYINLPKKTEDVEKDIKE